MNKSLTSEITANESSLLSNESYRRQFILVELAAVNTMSDCEPTAVHGWSVVRRHKTQSRREVDLETGRPASVECSRHYVSADSHPAMTTADDRWQVMTVSMSYTTT